MPPKKKMQAWEHNRIKEEENELLKYKTAKVVNEKGEYPEINSLPGRKLVDGVFMVFYNNMWMTVDKYKKQRENHSRPSPLYPGLPKTTSGKKDAQTLVSNLGTRPARASKPFSVQVHVPVTRDILPATREAAVSAGETKTAAFGRRSSNPPVPVQSTSLEYPDSTKLHNYLSGYSDMGGRFIPYVIYKGNPMPLSEYKVLYKKHNPPPQIFININNRLVGKMIESPKSGMAKVEVINKDKASFLKQTPFRSYITFWPRQAMDKIISRKEGGRKTRRKKKHRRKTKRKRKKRKRRTRKKRGRGIGLSRPAKVAAIGALTLGSGVATVSPTAKQTYQEIMRAPCNAPFRQMVLPHHPDKGGNIDDFSFVESARQSRKKSCGRTRRAPRAAPKKEKAPPGKSGKRWRREQNEQRRQAKEEARKQSERQEEADRKTGQQKPSDTTDYGDMARKIGATAAVLGGLEYVRRRPGYGPNNPRPRRSLTPPRR